MLAGRRIVAAGCLLFAVHPAALAQGGGIVTTLGFESLYKDINDVSLYFTCWHLKGELRAKGDCPSTKNGVGLEVLYDVAKVTYGKRVYKTPTIVPVSVTKKCPAAAGSCEADTTYTVSRDLENQNYFLLGFGLGYSQFSGFTSTDTSLTLRGTVRESPAISLYGQFVMKGFPVWLRLFEPYVGLRSGLLQLNNFYASTHPDLLNPSAPVSTYSAGATTFQAGALAGLQVNLLQERIHFFAEYVAQMRKFNGVQWAGTSIPRNLPQTLDFSGRQWTLGVEALIRS